MSGTAWYGRMDGAGARVGASIVPDVHWPSDVAVRSPLSSLAHETHLRCWKILKFVDSYDLLRASLSDYSEPVRLNTSIKSVNTFSWMLEVQVHNVEDEMLDVELPWWWRMQIVTGTIWTSYNPDLDLVNSIY